MVEVGLIHLAIIAVIFSVIGAFYYLRVVKVIYFDEPAEGAPKLSPPEDLRLIFTLNALAILVLGLMPDGLLELCLALFVV